MPQYFVESDSRPGVKYTVTEQLQGNGLVPIQSLWSCSCIGWTRHVPRKDCKHIQWVQVYWPAPVEPMLMATLKARRKAKL